MCSSRETVFSKMIGTTLARHDGFDILSVDVSMFSDPRVMLIAHRHCVCGVDLVCGSLAG